MQRPCVQFLAAQGETQCLRLRCSRLNCSFLTQLLLLLFLHFSHVRKWNSWSQPLQTPEPGVTLALSLTSMFSPSANSVGPISLGHIMCDHLALPAQAWDVTTCTRVSLSLRCSLGTALLVLLTCASHLVLLFRPWEQAHPYPGLLRTRPASSC